MSNYALLPFVLLAVHFVGINCVVKDDLPHIVTILVDDWGWSNFGSHREGVSQGALEQHTPNIDSLLNSGVDLNRHYAYKICSPSRSSLQSGRHPDHVNPLNTGVLVNNPSDPVSGYQGIPKNMTGIAEKLKTKGYKTHMTGKWDAGMATPSHTPQGRGYDSFYGYFQHANNYWNKGGHIEATGNVDLCLNRFTDLFMENATYRGGVLDSGELSDKCLGSDKNPGDVEDPECYEEHIFKKKTLEVIENHDEETPLFLFHAFHLIHTPLNVPASYLEKVDMMINPYEFDSAARRNYSAMVYYMDEVVGEIVDALKAKGMYDDTVIALMSDNGGPLYLPGAANNAPLKGGKYSDWEGGVRTNALISGGKLPEEARGTVYNGLVSIADWFGMFCDLVGLPVDDPKSEAANDWLTQYRPDLPSLPPVDALSGLFSKIVSGDKENAHPVLPLSSQALIKYPYKIVTGIQPYSNWTGELFPNCTTLEGPLVPWHNDSNLFEFHLDWSLDEEELAGHLWKEECAGGCLFNIETDPNETNDLAAAEPEVLRELAGLLDDHVKTLFVPDRGVEDHMACQHSASVNGGFYGPWLEVEGYYTGPFRKLSLKQKLFVEAYDEFLEVLSHPRIEEEVYKITQKIYPKFLVGPLEKSFDCCMVEGVVENTCVDKEHGYSANGVGVEGIAMVE
ncbi:hypothetical protein TrVE_jg9564 [Triparma verrucosa]|uniref:Sulfatase N-terminal domain-containing protein n=1 Tax=Triparma verrucosa TaxID=1606542 RepID=A0A9W7BL22_9STRA|nr:hypothetical protein TrVE_jg9564 [Triparma verrucosa]